MATIHGDGLRMGPAGNQWHFRPADRTYDLTRHGQQEDGSQQAVVKPLVIRTTTTGGCPAADAPKIAVDARRTALVVVDMQNFFLHPRCRDHPTGRDAVAPTLRVIDACRRAGIQVVWLNWGLTDADLAAMPAAVVTGFARSMLRDSISTSDTAPVPYGLGVDLGDGRGRMLTKGAWNAQVYEGGVPEGSPSLAAQVRRDLGDVLCDKTRMSGMWSPQEPLRRYLARAETNTNDAGRTKQTLLFAGVNTDQCVLGTLADAYNNGWDCVAIADCCATTTPGGQAATMANVANCYGFAVDSTAFVQGVDAYCA